MASFIYCFYMWLTHLLATDSNSFWWILNGHLFQINQRIETFEKD
jgi:hypothetical protein